jgi:hypothetical protein
VARARLETCPACRRSLPDFGDWPPWCPECGWGLESDSQSTEPASRFGRWWRRRTDRAENAELQRILAGPALLARPHPRRFAIYAAAVAVHLVTLGLLATGAWVMTTHIVTVLKVGAGIVVFGLVVVTVPIERLRPATAAKRTDAPTTLAVAATIARAVDVAAPARVRVTSAGQLSRPTSGRIVTVDLDRWQGLGASGRTAMLAHELAHHNGHDPRRTMLVTLASETIDGWLALLRQDPAVAGRRAARQQRRGSGGTHLTTGPTRLVGLSELLVPLVIAPLYLTVLVIGWILREGGTVAGLRAELYADRLAAGAAGLDGARYVDSLLGGQRDDIPELERERRRRIAVAAGSRSDAMHPTYAARLELLAAIDRQPSAARLPVTVTGPDLDSMSRELVALRTPNE